MTIKHFDHYQDMSTYGASIVMEALKDNPRLLVCTATGGSPTGLYQALVEANREKKEHFRELRVIKLDEWLGLGSEDPGSCENYLQSTLVKPLEINDNRYISFLNNPEDPEIECSKMDAYIEAHGPIDLCVLGLGKNGHLGLNEPSDFLQPQCHVAKLTAESQQHQMIAENPDGPTEGMTLGMGAILKSKHILLLISGEGKEEAKQQLMSGNITTQCPASFLWLHPQVDCLVVK